VNEAPRPQIVTLKDVKVPVAARTWFRRRSLLRLPSEEL
jgi:hypothetical protein